MKLSLSAARAATPGDVLRDEVVTGLTLRARVGAKTFSLIYRTHAGQQRRYTIGAFPEITIEKARDVARGVKGDVAAGKDPAASKTALKGAPTVQVLAETYLADPENVTGVEPNSWREKARHITKQIVPAMGRVLVSDVTTSDVNRMITAISRKGLNGKPAPVAANRCRDTLSSMFAYAERDDIAFRPRGTNPARGTNVRVNTEMLRSRVASPTELMRLCEELDRIALDPFWTNRVIAIRCILFCGSRVTEMVTAKRDWLQDCRLILVRHKTSKKTGAPRIIAFPKQALNELEGVTHNGKGFLFGERLDANLIDNCYTKARIAAGIDGLQLRDMRRTFASAGKSAGRSLAQIGDILGHTNPATTRRYAWLFDAEIGGIVQDTADILERRMGRASAPKAVRKRIKWDRQHG